MIVISGALVLVALVLLVIGLVSTSLGFVYASIAVSVVSFVFLLVGILQRRGEQVPEPASDAAPALPVAAASGSDVEGVTTIPSGSARAEETVAAPAPAARVASAPAAADDGVTGDVLVVPGRPRYHVSGCRYLTGKDPEEVAVTTARADGYTACGVCKPDDVLAEEAAAQPHPQPDEPIPAAVPAAPVVDEAPARRTTRATTSRASAPAKAAPAKKAPAKAAAKKAPAKAAADKPAGVVVIPDRDKFHRPDCRFVRDASDTKEISRTTAARQGYAACGVCKP